MVAHGFDMHGEPVTIEGSELLARAIQHETDHLDGVLFVDRLDPEARKAAMKAIRESEWFGLEQPTVKVSPARHPRAGALTPMRLVFAGTPEVAAARRSTPSPRPATSSSASSPAPTRPPGAAASWSRSPVGRSAPRSSACRCSSPTHPRDPEFQDGAARAARPTAARWSRTARCCPQSALDIPPHGWVNLHFSVLPAWRGAAPVQHAIWAGDEVTGATTFRIVKELDAGPTFGVMTERIRPDDTAGDLLARLAEGGAGLLVATLDGIEDGVAGGAAAAGRGRQLRPEDHRRRRPGRLGRAGGRGRPADPGLHARARRLVDLRRASGSRSARSPRSPTARRAGARACSRSTKNAVLVGTGTVPVRLGEVKAFGKKQMAAADWARGVRVETRRPIR